MGLLYSLKAVHIPIFIDGVALAKQGDKALGSVCPFVSLCALSALPNAERVTTQNLHQRRVFTSLSCGLCVCNQ